jgi:hypothetical protein
MPNARLRIDDRDVSLGEVWAHFKSPPFTSAIRFSLLVPAEYVVEVFDERRSKAREISWEAHIENFLRRFGSMALDRFIHKLKRIEKVDSAPFAWVIISVDAVKIVNDGVLLEGIAEPFEPNLPLVLKPLS